jgi:streptogramin lyase
MMFRREEPSQRTSPLRKHNKAWRELKPHPEALEARQLLAALSWRRPIAPPVLSQQAVRYRGPSAEAFAIPGQAGQTVKATFRLTGRESAYRNEVGLFLVDDASGRIGKLKPGDRGYDRAALARRVVLFGGQSTAGASVEVHLPQGGFFGTYVVPNGTSEQWLRHSQRGLAGRVYFSFLKANADRYPHVLQPKTAVFAFEDLWRGGDRDHNDSVVSVTFPQITPEKPPALLIQQPANGLLTNRDVLIVGLATDDRSGVARVETRMDGGAYRSVSFDNQGRFQFQAGLALDGSADGAHLVEARAIDRSGLVSPTASVTFTLDTRPPVVSLQTPAPGVLTRENVTVTGTIADALSGASSLEAQVDSGRFQPVSFNAASGAFSLPTALDLDGSADGPHTVRFRGTDRAGNLSAPVSLSFTLDTTPPPVVLDLDPAFDTAPLGDLETTLATVSLRGQTEPDTLVVLDGLGLSTRSDTQGTFSFSGAPLLLGGNPFTARATDAAGNVGTGATTVTLVATCGFEPDLSGWTVGREGGTTPGQGTVTVLERRAVLVEGDSFEVTLSHSFLVPQNPTTIGFEYDALAFDTADPGFINDAFEVALLGENGRSIVSTFATDRDAFFNISEGLSAAIGSGVTVAGQRVTLDISQAIPGTTATLVFRLVNNDSDTTTSVAILCAAGLPSSVPTAVTATPTLALTPDGALAPRSSLASGVVPAGPASTLRDTGETRGLGGPPAQTPLGDSLLDSEGRVTFTTSEDFLLGTLFNTDATTVQDQLALVPPGEAQTFAFIWISNSGESTVSRLDTHTGREIGRYRTGGTGGDPSRIAVTGQGDAWVANRAGAGTVVKVLLDRFIDRNGNGVVDTCQDLNGDGRITGSEVLPWDANGDGQPDDERIAFVLTVGGGLRGVATDASDKLWVCPWGSGTPQFSVYDSETGVLESTVPTPGYGSYGAVIDRNGQLWSVTIPGGATIVHIDTTTRKLIETVNVPAGAYGITADRDGIIWMSAQRGGALSRYDPANRELTTYQITGASFGGGITVDPEGNVWLGSNWTSQLTKVSFESDRKTYKSTTFVQVGAAPKSASVDADGYIWTACLGSNEAYKINPTTATVVTGWPVPTGVSPYNYSDMTGEVRLTVTGRSGSWTEIIDGQTARVPWIGVGLDAEAPAKTSVALRVRASDRRESLAQLAWLDVTPGSQLAGIQGRFLEVQARLTSSDPTTEPFVRELSVQSLPAPTVEVISPAVGTSINAGTAIVLSGLATAAQPVLPDGNRARNAITHVLVNGKPVDVLDESGRFFTRVTIQPGDNAFIIEAGDLYDQTATTQIVVTGTQRVPGAVDFSQLSDITASFTADYARTSYAKAGRVLNADTAVRNIGQYPVDALLYVAIANLSDPSVTPLDAAGFTPEGHPYYDVSALVPGGRLAPDGSTGTLAFRFQVPAETRFGYDLRFFGLLNRPPAFTTVPVVDAVVGRTYAHDSDAVDPDREAVRYALATAPGGMSIDEATGLLSWTPTEADLGSHPVVVRATDPRGGMAEQQFQVRVTTPPPNRPPVFVSTPIIAATPSAVPSTTPVSLTLTGWTPIHFNENDSDPDPSWVLGESDTSATQVANSDATILLSDRTYALARIQGTLRVDTAFDDDSIGFVYGYRDAGHFDLFSWNCTFREFLHLSL